MGLFSSLNVKNAILSKLPDSVRDFIQMADQSDVGYVGRMTPSVSMTLPTKEPQRTYMWEVSISDPSSESVPNITLYAKQTAVPPSMTEAVKRWYAGVEYTYAGRDVSSRVFRVTFWDNEELDVYRFFNRWNSLIHSGEEKHKVNPVDYFGSAKISLLRSTGKNYNNYSFSSDNILLGAAGGGVVAGVGGLVGGAAVGGLAATAEYAGKALDDISSGDTVIGFKDIFPIEISEIALSYGESTEITFDVMFAFRHKEVLMK